MDAIDWEEIWNRLKGMLWSAGALGIAGLCAGLWIYGVELPNTNAHQPALYQPSMLDEGIRAVIGSIHGSYLLEAVAMLAWLGAVLWIYLIPEAAGKRRLRAALGSVVGLLVAFLIDGIAGWGEADLWVRFGALLGCGAYLGIGLVLGERGKGLIPRIIRGGLSGGFIGLVCVFAAQIEFIGYAAGIPLGARTVLSPTLCGLIIGLTLRGAELLFAGSVTEQWRRYWPLITFALIVLINAIGPVLLVQHWFASGGL